MLEPSLTLDVLRPVIVAPVTFSVALAVKVLAVTLLGPPFGCTLPVTSPVKLPIKAPALSTSEPNVHSPSDSSHRNVTLVSSPLSTSNPASTILSAPLKLLFNTIMLSSTLRV